MHTFIQADEGFSDWEKLEGEHDSINIESQTNDKKVLALCLHHTLQAHNSVETQRIITIPRTTRVTGNWQ